ncbi:Peptidoglycan O-acetyltransferase [Dyadobacter sp. CECT 9623]|uniref:Peptidoglycan O-acetyltransferase n=1 Tax=Dyadobacter linearis TaxID=2823330 RepID=A0ABM8UKK5_9BACT|nr:MBOAT family O-acyltransferase [Dyadobacter sp. CECT 9623]CAG5067791.1 Peptidoglycan O-acetyltransferase [Dyadobacter sp. CECT 9623]
MLFNSIEFIVFFTIVFVLYWFVLNRHLKAQNAFLLVVSYFFYGWWDWRFLLLIFTSSSIDYFLGHQIWKTQNPVLRKRLVLVSIVFNLCFLGFFKYFNFFVDSFIGMLTEMNVPINVYTLHIILPVGISFYTFQSLSYTIDIYKKKLEPSHNILNFFAFVSFFPQLVAGPIERAEHLLPQFFQKRKFDYAFAASGGRLILKGFFKKIVIADSLAILVDTVYNNPEAYTGFPMVVATIFFTFQIYCDFSGYSDIAIGTARLLGFDMRPNFASPYFSRSLTEFWRRWHISLSTWFRDYLYIPLGGNRTSTFNANRNLLITFTLSGLWHGANWTYVIWGFVHGLGLIVEKTFNIQKADSASVLVNAMRMILTLVFVAFAWIFFRSNNLSDAIYIITHMFSDIRDYTDPMAMSLKFRGVGLKPEDLLTSVFFLVVLLVMEYVMANDKLRTIIYPNPRIRWAAYYFFLIAIVFSATKNPAGNFIYFQF